MNEIPRFIIHENVLAWAEYLNVLNVDIIEYISTGNPKYLEYKFHISTANFTDEIQFCRPITMSDDKFLDNIREIYENKVIGRATTPPLRLQHVLNTASNWIRPTPSSSFIID